MQYDAILVLGRGIKPDGQLPESSIASVTKAVEFYNQGLAPRIILSGKWSRSYDFVPPATEAATMKQRAIDLGVPAEAILIEEESLDTISNFYFVKKNFLIPNQWHRLLLILVNPQEERALFLASYVLGPEYEITGEAADFMFPPEKIAELAADQVRKLEKLRNFFAENNIEPGDHEGLYKAHIQYVNDNP